MIEELPYQCGKKCTNFIGTHPKHGFIINCKKKGNYQYYNDDCASHSEFQSEREKVERILKRLDTVSVATPELIADIERICRENATTYSEHRER